MRTRLLTPLLLCLSVHTLSCTDGAVSQDVPTDGTQLPRIDGGFDAVVDGVSDIPPVATDEGGVTPRSCADVRCPAAGESCLNGACVRDCRGMGATACAMGDVCDFVDGLCKAPSPCVVTGSFSLCNEGSFCGPGTECNGEGRCVPDGRCQSVQCDANRCYGQNCPCMRPAPRCQVAPLEQLNRPEFAGARPINDRGSEGIMDLEFDDICTAYAVTTISGNDQLRQMTSDGTLTATPGATNLDMGEVAVLRNFRGTFGMSLGEVALTYICIAGCLGGGPDAQQGVAKFDRMNMMRPLPNVIQSMITVGAGPFFDRTTDAGPFGLTYAQDGNLYVGNVDANGEFYRVVLSTGMRTLIYRFASRVHASTVFDGSRLLVALENREIWLLNLNDPNNPTRWATMPGAVTSMTRDRFTGRVYAELRMMDGPQIVDISPDGMNINVFQRPARLGRIAIAPDNFLYHTATFPNVQWNNVASPAIVRFPLPAMR